MRIVISGTYGTGKSTLAKDLATRTGLPLVGATGMREILNRDFHGKSLTECTPSEIVSLGIRRFRERISSETKAGSSFVSDGSTLNEWAYGLARRKFGITPDDKFRKIRHDDEQQFFDNIVSETGRIFYEYALESYDCFLQLPIEFPITTDGHRPASDIYREFSNNVLTNAIGNMRVTSHTVYGSPQERLDRSLQLVT
jgi:hypothetical protein